MKQYDYLIVGSGLFGSTFACMAKRQGKKCLVIDKRPQLGGNLYCENIEGINVHQYGAHIFHTSNKEAFEQKINELLRDDWDFDRLSMLEQAILLISFQEILANDTPKAVVINEAITLAKKYCDDNSYKLLNGVLDQL